VLLIAHVANLRLKACNASHKIWILGIDLCSRYYGTGDPAASCIKNVPHELQAL